MLHLLDANVLIDANRDYYSIKRVPEFWEWLLHLGENGDVKVPREVYEEFKDGPDNLGIWARRDEFKQVLLLDEEPDVSLVSTVTSVGYADDLTDDEVEKIGRDPFLIAYALAEPDQRRIVTTEVSRPSKQRANRRIPDVCADLGIDCCNTYTMVRDLNFRTSWDT